MEEAQVGKKDYDPKMMREVRDRVLSGELRMKQAAHEYAEYGTSSTSLWTHVKNRRSPSKRPGNQGKVSFEDQKSVSSQWCWQRRRHGQPRVGLRRRQQRRR